jgi:anti-anti-sigma factor
MTDVYRGQLDYMDSAALGMLLQFKEHLGGDGIRITILTRQGAVSDILRVSRFDKLFILETT